MRGRLFRGATLLELSPLAAGPGDLRVRGGLIVERGPALPAAGDEVVDCTGGVIIPGLVNAHTHLYSALARGMPAPPVEDFEGALERVWWPLDRSLEVEDVRASALVGLADALRCGVTTLIDHHASPSAIAGSVAAVLGAGDLLGARLVTAYELTDRNGADGRDAGLEENRRAIAEGASAERRALLGLHAGFTLSDESLQAAAELPGPVHVHVAESRGDVEHARALGYAGPVERLARWGLLRRGSVLAHGVHLNGEEVERAVDAGAWLVHNPASNRNNRVGYARPGRFGARGALGTDGLGQDMFAALREAFLAAREHRHAVDPLALLAGSHRLASELLGLPLGALAEGAAADLVLLDYPPPTPLDDDSAGGHWLFGVEARHVRSVWVGGRPVVIDRRLVGLGDGATAARGRRRAAGLWARYKDTLGG